MAITFDNDIASLNGLDRYDRIIVSRETGGVGYGNILKETDVDFFTDDAGVGDVVNFGWAAGVWHDLKVNVGTPLVADSISIVWEYSNNAYTWAPLTCIDGTNAFQNAGINTVSFDIPDDFKCGGYNIPIPAGLYVNNLRLWTIRARIVSVTNLTEGGANATDYITGKDYAVMVTGTGNTPQSIYSSGVAGSLMEKLGNSYLLKCHLRIGDYSTFTDFTISDCSLQVGEYGDEGVRRTIIAQKNTDEWYMGSSDEGGELGGSLIFYSNYPVSHYNYFRTKCYWYNSFFKKPYSSYSNASFSEGIKVIKNCVFSQMDTFFFTTVGVGSVLENSVLEMKSDAGWWYVYTDKLKINNLTFTRGKGVLTTESITLENVNFRDKEFANYYLPNSAILNCSMDDYDTQLTGLLKDNANVSVLFTLGIDILDSEKNVISGCNVKIESEEGVVFNDTWTTDFNARIFYKERIDGVISSYAYNPFTITITKDGYETYESKFEITEKTDLIITLKPVVPIRISTEGPVLALAPETGSSSLLKKL